jgi:hemerythrin-like metal-binding protein
MTSSKRAKPHSVYIPKLDDEHSKISRDMDELNRTVAAGGEAHELLQDLIEDMSSHLAGEERMMRSAAYPSYAWHKHQHDAARNRLKRFAERIDAGESAAVCEMVDFFRLWLRDHTGLHDRMMAAYLRNFGRAHDQAAS